LKRTGIIFRQGIVSNKVCRRLYKTKNKNQGSIALIFILDDTEYPFPAEMGI
jgi:hypothetical protein